MDRVRDSPPLVGMAIADMLERSRLLGEADKPVVLWGDSLLDYASISNQRLRPPSDILDLGLDRPLVDILGDHPQVLADLLTVGIARQGDLTCCAATGSRIWAPVCASCAWLSIVDAGSALG